MVVGAYGLRFGNPEEKDLTDEWFAPDTDYGPHGGDGMTTTFHHCHPVHKELKALAERIFGPVKAIKDEIGIFVTAVLDMADEYERVVGKLVEAGRLRWSSGTASHLILRDDDTGRIKRWHIIEWAYTPQAAEPRLPVITPLKSYGLSDEDIENLLADSRSILPAREQPDESGAGAEKGASSLHDTVIQLLSLKPTGGKAMTLEEMLSKINELVPGLSDEQASSLANSLALGFSQPPDMGGEAASEPDETMAVDEEDEEEFAAARGVPVEAMGQLIKLAAQMGAANAKPAKAAKPTPAHPAKSRPAYDWKPSPAAQRADDQRRDAEKAFHALYQTRFGAEDEVKAVVLSDLVGKDYRQVIWDQNRAYATYLRNGDRMLDREAFKSLQMQIFPSQQIMELIANGFDVKSIKDVMVEAQGTLGGYAVPPNVQNEIITRLPGLVVVRGAGAVVITLVNSNSTDIPIYSGGDKRYRGRLRGQWGTETQQPTEQYATLQMDSVQAHIYTYKVPMSQSMVEDAANLVSLVTDDIAITMGLDEDDVFLVGDGVGKPMGILPGGVNKFDLAEVNSGAAAALTTVGIKKLKRGIASQYRKEGIWVGNSDTYSEIEVLQDGAGNFAFPDLSDEDMMLKRKAYESEALPDVAANAFPLIFGAMRGYRIVERLGFTIARMQDSNTGLNKVEYHVRRRIGGRIMEPWCFALQKVAA